MHLLPLRLYLTLARHAARPQVRTLSETVRLDARTKLLNPKWYEGMLSSGYEGVREIQKRLTNTMGWSATSGEWCTCHLGGAWQLSGLHDMSCTHLIPAIGFVRIAVLICKIQVSCGMLHRYRSIST